MSQLASPEFGKQQASNPKDKKRLQEGVAVIRPKIPAHIEAAVDALLTLHLTDYILGDSDYSDEHERLYPTLEAKSKRADRYLGKLKPDEAEFAHKMTDHIIEFSEVFSQEVKDARDRACS